jgi:hypothetical protein
MDDTIASQRLKTLHGEIAQLTTRAQDLADTIVIEDLRACLADPIGSGTPAERKAAIEPSSPKCASPMTGSPRVPDPRPFARRSPVTQTPRPILRLAR